MLRAGKAVSPPADQRCYGFPRGVAEALKTRTPTGWYAIGWVAADSGRKTWVARDTMRTGEGRPKRQSE